MSFSNGLGELGLGELGLGEMGLGEMGGHRTFKVQSSPWSDIIYLRWFRSSSGPTPRHSILNKGFSRDLSSRRMMCPIY